MVCRRVTFLHLVLLILNIHGAFSASILDIIWSADGSELIESRNDVNDNQKSCSCIEAICKCCVDFNFTYIDLGGPGCVEMRYVSQDEGVAVNVSYGDSLLHSENIRRPNPKPACISLLGSFAEVCAQFSSLEPHDDGLKGCLLLEPKFLGNVQTQFDIGCFLMGPDGMQLDANYNSTINQPVENNTSIQNTTENEGENGGFNEEELIAVVNESAKQGLLFFGNLLGLAFSNSDVNNTDITTQTNVATSETSRKERKLSPKLNRI